VIEHGHFEDGDEIVHEFSGSDLDQKMITAVLDANVGQLKNSEPCP